MTNIKKIQPNTSRSSLYNEVNNLRSLSAPQQHPVEDDEGDDLYLKSYLKWVGVLSIIALLVGFCTAAITN
jgi:hypothetical protein